MKDLTAVALAKFTERLADGIWVPVGIHQVDETITLHVTGTIEKRKTSAFTPTVEIPLLLTMALFLEKSGITREVSKQLLIEAMTEAIKLNVSGNETISTRLKDVESAMVHVREVIGSLPKKNRKGGTFIEGELEEIFSDWESVV